MTEEKNLQNKMLAYLKTLKEQGKIALYEKRQAGGFSYKKGIPDIYFVCFGGLHVEVEVKAKDGKQSAMQEKFETLCLKNQIPYMLINDLSDFKVKVNELIK